MTPAAGPDPMTLRQPSRRASGSRQPKEARKTAKKTAIALVPRPDGRGALLAGGVPGNAGGPGRPRSAVRALALEGADVAVPKLVAILENPKSRPAAVVAAAAALLKYGLGTVREVSVDEVKDRLRLTVAVIRGELAPADAERVLAAIRPIWTP